MKALAGCVQQTTASRNAGVPGPWESPWALYVGRRLSSGILVMVASEVWVLLWREYVRSVVYGGQNRGIHL